MSDPTAGDRRWHPNCTFDEDTTIAIVGNQDAAVSTPATMAHIASLIYPASAVQIEPQPITYHQDYLASIDVSVRLVEPKDTEYSGPPRNRHERRAAKRKGRR